MKNKKEASVILATYNRPEILKLVLLGYQRQSLRDFEIVIADDGSKDDVKAVIEEFKKTSFFDIIYIWQPDEGWRKCAIVNKAILAANSDYLIFSDADMIPHHDFVKTHIQYRQKNAVLLGRWIRWGKWLSSRITINEVISGRYEKLTWDKWLAFFCGGIKHFQKSIPIKNKFLLKCLNLPNKQVNLYGGNFSMWKEDMLKLNGFNERMVYWGREDCELDVRVKRLGLKRISVRHQAILFHLDHPRDKSQAHLNLEILKETESSEGYVWKL